jgi:hypothetical protein
MPPGLDREGKKKFRELIETCEPDADVELMSNYARQHSILLSIRREAVKQKAAGMFETMVRGRDGSQVLNPLIVGETRAIAALNRMLKQLGLTASREETGRPGRKLLTEPPPAGMQPGAKEPPWGWAIEDKLCGPDSDFLPGGKYGTKN